MVTDREETSWTKFSDHKARVIPVEEDIVLWTDTDLGARRLGVKACPDTD